MFDAEQILAILEDAPGVHIRCNNPHLARSHLREAIRQARQVHPEAYKHIVTKCEPTHPLDLYIINLNLAGGSNAEAGNGEDYSSHPA